MANFAVNNSNKAGTVFFGEDSVTVGPYGKLELKAMPSYWTKNIQLVKGISRSRGEKTSVGKVQAASGSAASGSAASGSAASGSKEGETNG